MHREVVVALRHVRFGLLLAMLALRAGPLLAQEEGGGSEQASPTTGEAGRRSSPAGEASAPESSKGDEQRSPSTGEASAAVAAQAETSHGEGSAPGASLSSGGESSEAGDASVSSLASPARQGDAGSQTRANVPAEAEDAEEHGALQELVERLDALERLHVSGYVQTGLRARDLGSEQSAIGVRLRRGRVRFRYRFDWARFDFELDASGAGNASIRDLFLTLNLLDGDARTLRLRVGQFKTPFGLTVPGSSSRRFFPERFGGFTMLFPGERDLGAMLALHTGALRLDVAFMNGATLKDAFRSQYDLLRPTTLGDLLLRATVESGPVRLGASALYGRGWHPAQEDDPETMQDESFDAFEFGRWALAAHAALKLNTGLQAQAEVVYARNLARRRASQFPTPDAMARETLAFYGWVVQPLSDVIAAGVRFGGMQMDGGETDLEVEPLLHLQFTKEFRVQLAYRSSLRDATDNDGYLRFQIKF